MFLNSSSKQCSTINENIITKLKPHQKASIYQAEILESSNRLNIGDHIMFNSKIGILCDNVGSGKSLTILSIIANNKIIHDEKIKTDHNGNHIINIFRKPKFNSSSFIETNVIVVPHNILKQWEKYILADTKLKFRTISTNKHIKELFELEENINELNNVDIVLVSSTRYNTFCDRLNIKSICVSRLIFDEADSIKIPGCRQLKANFFWLITSNIKSIKHPNGIIKYANENGDLSDWYNWNTGHTRRVVEHGIKCRGFVSQLCYNIHMILEDVQDQIFIRNDLDFIKQSFALEPPIVKNLLCKDPPLLNVLSQVVSNNVMDHINAGDVEGAIDSINCTKVNESNLISLVTQDLNDELHNKMIELEAKKSQIFSSSKIKEESILKTEKKILDLKMKIENLKNKLEESSTCPICYDKVNNITLCGNCNTKFCLECITMWLASSSGKCQCPFCRSEITNQSLIIVSDKCVNPEKKKVNVLKSKLENLNSIVKDRLNNKAKILIFSKYDGSFKDIKSKLISSQIEFSQILGSATRINNVVENYNRDFDDPKAINVLLLNSQHFGSGLNLQNSSDIILYHHMSDELTNQVVGRAQRPGRVGKLNIWRLCYSNEIDKDFKFN